MQDDVMQLVGARQGHFRLESGHHGALWLDLESLCLHPNRVRPIAMELARRLADYHLDAVCGPLVEGAFVALMVAAELNVEFYYSLRHEPPSDRASGLYTVQYRMPEVLRASVRGKRVAIVNDVINAGSAVRGTYFDLAACGAETPVMGALLILGDSAQQLAAEWRIDLVGIDSQPNQFWTPAECPLCRARVPLDAPSEEPR